MDLLVATFIGADAPGLVHALAEVVSDHGGNWQTSHMTSAGGVFAGVVVIEVHPDRVEALGEDLEGLEGMLRVSVQRGDTTSESDRRTRFLTVDIAGGDHPGIVEVVAAAVARPRVNVRRLDSHNEDAQGGGTSCRVVAQLELADGADEDALASELDSLAAELGVHITVQGPAVQGPAGV